MYEKRRRPGRGERGGDLLADVAAFADAGDDDAAADGRQPAHGFLEGLREVAAKLCRELGQSLGFEIERTNGGSNRRRSLPLCARPRGLRLGLDEGNDLLHQLQRSLCCGVCVAGCRMNEFPKLAEYCLAIFPAPRHSG